MIGTTISHYRIIEKLGRGGMGVVYKALDTKLDRMLALKFLPQDMSADEDAKQRFIQEAKAASALDHSNICTIHDIGETEAGELYIVKAYYEGQTPGHRLEDEAFSIERAVDVTTHLAQALECAHEAGIIHRDVKPANIMLTDRGEVKLLDFGLAKLAGGAELTVAGATLGTAAYMSPEQARGAQVTTATDIWALGAVMYEMFTGAKPVAAEYDQALLYGILNEDPQPAIELRPEVPNSAQTAGDIDRSVAVLPSKLLSATDPEASAVFAGGMHDDVLAQLAKIGELKVIARTSVMQYENTTTTIRDIARELNVASVREGSIKRAGNRVRVNISLVNGATENPMWSETDDEELTPENIFSTQTDLATSIAEALHTTLSPEEKGQIMDRPEVPTEAYDLYTKAMYLWQSSQSLVGPVLEAVNLLEQALKVDPYYALAHARLAGIYVAGIRGGILSPEEYLETARKEVERALEIDPREGEAYIAQGNVAETELDFEGAEKAYLRAIEVSPGTARAHRAYGSLVYKLGRPAEALESALRAVEIDPMAVAGRQGLADILFFLNDYDGSMAESTKILEMDPGSVYAHYNLGYCLVMTNRLDDGIHEFEEALRLDPRDPDNTLGLAWAHAKAGHRSEAVSLIADIEDNPAMLREKAIIFGILGDLDTAFEYLNRAVDQNPGAVTDIAGDTSVPDKMRNDPRFAALVRRLGL